MLNMQIINDGDAHVLSNTHTHTHTEVKLKKERAKLRFEWSWGTHFFGMVVKAQLTSRTFHPHKEHL